MKRHLITLLFLLLALQGVAQQAIYDKYAYREDVLVALVRNIQFDSTHTIDCLLFRAMDDNGWQWMVEEFELSSFVHHLFDDDTSVVKHLVKLIRNKNDITQSPPMRGEMVDLDHCCLVVVDIKQSTLYVFFAPEHATLDILIHSNNN